MQERALGWTWSLCVHALLWAGASVLVFYPPHHCMIEDVALLPKQSAAAPSYPLTIRPRDLVEWQGDSESDIESLRAGVTHRGPDVPDQEGIFRLPASSASEAAVTASLFWLARHQSADGRWSADGFDARCSDGRCRDAGDPGFDHRLILFASFGAGRKRSGLLRASASLWPTYWTFSAAC